MVRAHTEKAVHIAELDGLRGLAALGVTLFHLRIFLAGASNPITSVPGGDWIVVKGWHLVDLFFVLSGFIFAHCYLHDGRMRQGVHLSKFTWARIARLLPVHVVIVCFTGFMLRHDPGTTGPNFLLSLVMLHAFLPNMELLNPPVWSISVELLCYTLFAILAIKAGSRRFPFASIVLATIGAFLVLSETFPSIGRGLLGFFTGCLVQQNRDKLSRIHWSFLLLAVAPPFVLGAERQWLVVESIISWPALLLLAPRVAAFRASPLQWLGSRSYAIYLVHVPLFIFFGHLALDFPVLPTNLAIVICMTMVLLFADILHRRVELPMQAKLLDWRLKREHPRKEKLLKS